MEGYYFNMNINDRDRRQEKWWKKNVIEMFKNSRVDILYSLAIFQVLHVMLLKFKLVW